MGGRVEIECPRHGSMFDLRTGKPCSLPATQPVAVYEVKVEGGRWRWCPVTAEHVFEVRDLHASAGGKEVLHGIDLTVRSGEVHVIMGPNGSGKSPWPMPSWGARAPR